MRINFNVFLGIIIQTAMRDGLIDAWPKVAFVYAHFMRADITHFEGFWKMKHEVDGLRGTIASIKSPYESDYAVGKKVFKPTPLVLKDEHRHTRRTFVRFVDTMLLTPGTQGLDAAGDLIGIPKLDLPEGYVKSEMLHFLQERPEEFAAYALRDADIAVRYGLRMRKFVTEELGLRGLPPTIGSLATSYFFNLLEDADGEAK